MSGESEKIKENKEKNKKIEIILDLDNINTRMLDNINGLLQKEAYKKIIDILNEKVNYLHTLTKEEKNDLDKCRVHNSIFINGERGSGKTFFLINLENYLNQFKCDDSNENEYKKIEEYFKNSPQDLKNTLKIVVKMNSTQNACIQKKFYFFKPIDPTLLHTNENFLTTIIAKILNNLEENSAFIGLDENEKKAFYKKLSNLAEAIDGVLCSENCAKTALELISKDQSSIKLIKYVHEFFMEISEILDNRILVLLIDDIDMAFEKGFEILEVIRKYLVTPVIIPIISGDLKLYKIIVNNKFIDRADSKDRDLENIKDKKEFLAKLTSDYLTKIFEINSRIKIKNLIDFIEEKDDIYKLKGLEKIILESKSFNIQINLKEVIENLLTKLNLISEKIEVRKEIIQKLLSNSLRKILQLVKDESDLFIYDNELESQEIMNRIILIEKNSEVELLSDKSILGKSKYEIYINNGDKYRSQEEYEKALEEYQEAKKIDSNLEILEKIAITYENLKLYTKTIEIYEEAVKSSNKKYDIYKKMSNTYLQEPNYKKALEMSIKALNLKDDYETNINVGNIYLEFSDYIRAENHLIKALEFAEKDFGKESKEVGGITNQLAKVYLENKKYNEAYQEIENALVINKSDDLNYEKSLNILGDYNQYIGEYDEALKYYEKAFEIIKENFGTSHYTITEIYDSFANLYSGKKEYNEAIRYYNMSLNIREKTVGYYHLSTAIACEGLGDVHTHKEEYNSAINYYKKALEIKLKTLGFFNPNMSTTYEKLGDVYSEKGDYDEAIEYYEKSLKIKKDIFGNNHPYTISIYESIANSYYDKGNYQKALEYYNLILKEEKKLVGSKHLNVAIRCNNIGYIHLENNDFYLGFENILKALEIYLELENNSNKEKIIDLINTLNMKENAKLNNNEKNNLNKLIDNINELIKNQKVNYQNIHKFQ